MVFARRATPEKLRAALRATPWKLPSPVRAGDPSTAFERSASRTARAHGGRTARPHVRARAAEVCGPHGFKVSTLARGLK
jgi:hypothetical protein